MKEMVTKKEVPHCVRKTCDGLVKPDIVFFGEALPEAFHRKRSLPARADLAIVMGTSLTVQPFASLPSFVREETPRVLINLERVGTFGSRPDDVLLLGDCDEGVRKFADALGWREELEELWETTNPDKDATKRKQPEPPKTRQEALDDEVAKLTRDIDASLKLSSEANERIRSELEKPDSKVTSDSQSPPDSFSRDQVTSDKVTTQAATNLVHVFPHLKEDRSDKPSL